LHAARPALIHDRFPYESMFVALAALISAYHDSPDAPGRLRATLPIAGRTLIERQARLAAAAGATPIVILVERVPAELAAAIDRLRAEGVAAKIARSVEEAAAAIAPDQHLLVVADGLLADRGHFSRLFSAGEASLLTVPDAGHDDRYERIDADWRWAGLALLDGDMLRRTAAMLQDWDLQSTLLRRAVQGGARQIALANGTQRSLVIAERAADLAPAQARLVEGAGGGGEDWVSRYLLGPVEASLTKALMPTRVTPAWCLAAALTLSGLGAIFFLQGWFLAALVVLLLATPLDGVADRLGALRLQRSGSWLSRALPIAAGTALLALGWALRPDHGWGAPALGAGAILFLVALGREIGSQPLPERSLLAERKGMTWLVLPFGAVGAWLTGLVVLTLYAIGSFFWAQRAIHRPKGRQD
jgi:hypothetical protein